MTAISTATNRDRYWDQRLMDAPLDASAGTVPKGALVMGDASGYAVNGADTTGCIFLGVAEETVVVASGGSDGDKTIELATEGVFKFAFGAGNAAITNVDTGVCITDNNTVDLVGTTTHDVYCGMRSSAELHAYASSWLAAPLPGPDVSEQAAACAWPS